MEMKRGRNTNVMALLPRVLQRFTQAVYALNTRSVCIKVRRNLFAKARDTSGRSTIALVPVLSAAFEHEVGLVCLG